jgi:RNA polymerase subunit RPABC4/transcription elongation factor Spt4
MKKCPNCHAEVNDNFDICWNCQYSFIENKVLENSDFELLCPNCNAELDASTEFCPNCNYDLNSVDKIDKDETDKEEMPLDCLRCKVTMEFKRNCDFHEGTTIGKSAIFFDLTTNQISLDLYVCPNCGKVEFFDPEFGRKKSF